MESLIPQGNIFYSIWILIGLLVIIITCFIIYEVRRKRKINNTEVNNGGTDLQFPEKEEQLA